ncbi:Protein tramtrack, alpha isoform [Operophtera brumata]|uniref:Protein tramtrack, alpha isoform n=1 Tax=Operophtera brumata TaxID=104452 RepID=A0A0L7LK60_OPEBR|nr:Protein tramtrack, alpha isoform [Operophtera brumata]
MTSTDTYQLKWHSHSAHLNGSVAALLRSERFTDVVLCTMDGSQIPAHKFILSSCSVYLSSLFDGQRSVMRMGGMLYVVLPSEISTKALKILVEYMYKGLLKHYSHNLAQPMFIGPPKLVFIKTAEGTTQAAIRPGTPMASKGQTILVAPAPINTEAPSTASVATSTSTVTMPTTMVVDDSPDEGLPPRHAVERKYGKRQKTDASVDDSKEKADTPAKEDMAKKPANSKSPSNSKDTKDTTTEIQIKDEPDWDNSSIEEEERSIAEMLQAEMNVKAEPVDEVDIEEESLMYSPLACELCAEVFTVPGAWVRHVEGHALDAPHARKRKSRSAVSTCPTPHWYPGGAGDANRRAGEKAEPRAGTSTALPRKQSYSLFLKQRAVLFSAKKWKQ